MEDFQTFTKAGAQQGDATVDSAVQITFVDVAFVDEVYIHKDYGVNHFSHDDVHTHDIDIKVTNATTGTCGGSASHIMTYWDLCNTPNTFMGHSGNGDHWIMCSLASWLDVPPHAIEIKERWGAVNKVSDLTGKVIVEGTTYYLRIVWDDLSLKCGIYSTSALRNAGDGTDGDIDNLSIILNEDYDLRYLTTCASRDHGVGTCDVDGLIQNLELNEAVPPVVRPTSSLVPTMEALDLLAVPALKQRAPWNPKSFKSRFPPLVARQI